MKTLILKALKAYKSVLSPIGYTLFGNACRFDPTCSDYTYQAIDKHGIKKGVILSIKRIVRCHPFSKPGYDPVI